MLFSERSIWTMVHGIGLGGGALIGLAAALFYLYAARSSDHVTAPPGSGALAGATVERRAALAHRHRGDLRHLPAALVPRLRRVTDLSEFPRALVLATRVRRGCTRLPWRAGAYAVDRLDADRGGRVRRRALPVEVLQNSSLRSLSMALLAISFALVAFVSLMGMFVNKVAPLD